MKKLLIGMVVVVGLFIASYFLFGITDDFYTLNDLENVSYNASLTYCTYTITEVVCNKPTRYKKNNVICLVCCTTRKPPWPQLVPPNNNCPKKIRFKEKQGGCEIRATRNKQTCTSCDPQKTMAVFECPNPP